MATAKRLVRLVPPDGYGVDGAPQFGWLELIGAFIAGGLILGAFIWTPLGREFTAEAVRRGAGVTRARVEAWIRAGER